jgi:hypothetical protein
MAARNERRGIIEREGPSESVLLILPQAYTMTARQLEQRIDI